MLVGLREEAGDKSGYPWEWGGDNLLRVMSYCRLEALWGSVYSFVMCRCAAKNDGIFIFLLAQPYWESK